MKNKKQRRALKFPLARECFGSRLIINGGRELLIENHKGLLEYTPEQICISSSGGSITVRGQNLKAAAMTRERILITGSLREITFGGGNGI